MDYVQPTNNGEGNSVCSDGTDFESELHMAGFTPADSAASHFAASVFQQKEELRRRRLESGLEVSQEDELLFADELMSLDELERTLLSEPLKTKEDVLRELLEEEAQLREQGRHSREVTGSFNINQV